MPKKKAKNRPEIEKETESTVSRRSVLKIGAAAGAATVLAPNIIATAKALTASAVNSNSAGSMRRKRRESGTYTF